MKIIKHELKSSSTSDVDTYNQIYKGFLDLRESFHRSGRLDDSNAKLDEVAKIFATYLAFRNSEIKQFPSENSPNLIKKLNAAFVDAANLDKYTLNDGSSIFGRNPAMSLNESDLEIAQDLVRHCRLCIDLAIENKSKVQSIDLLNEVFGHFIRDNFRGNIEDAQYMTPSEVVDFMSSLVLHDIIQNDKRINDKHYEWTMADPTCGVGSFLSSFYKHSMNSGKIRSSKLNLYGQDKVERMVRLSTINCSLFNLKTAKITIGNSLADNSPISQISGMIDVVLTNPPFGAVFNSAFLSSECAKGIPFISNLKNSSKSIESELLFIEKGMTLLKEGGRMLIVVPDGVISARGFADTVRKYLSRTSQVKAIVDLPSVAFAQAGTRTKTAVLYLEKTRPNNAQSVFMSSVRSLGFEVSSKKGVQVKTVGGVNELVQVAEAYFTNKTNFKKDNSLYKVLRTSPSCVSVNSDTLENRRWTPTHYSASGINAIERLKQQKNIELIDLGSLANFYTETRKAQQHDPSIPYFSILHIVSEGLIDLEASYSYAPKTPGIKVESGEILFSKINPRIPRIAIIPKINTAALCSSEFEILSSKSEISNYGIAYLLMKNEVQAQINSLTSGTSASHNRIRSSELKEVLLPVPKKGTADYKRFQENVVRYELAISQLSEASIILAQLNRQGRK
jgi:type I restriction-modification system DNA methylase subunit